LFTAFVICGADENVFEELNSYSTATLNHSQEKAFRLCEEADALLPAHR
jgi:hypothetical protein